MNTQVDRAVVFGERPEAVERIAPGFFSSGLEVQHLARYEWAARWVKDRVVLDIACGTGYGAVILREAGARLVVSVDLSHEALRFGLPRYALLPMRADAHVLPLRSAFLDTVVSIETLEHLADPLGFAKELSRLLRAGGELLLSTPNAIRSDGGNPYHLREFTLDELRSLLGEAGFSVETAWGQHWRLPYAICRKVRAVRRLAWEFERRPRVMSWAPRGSQPLYWCVRASKVRQARA